VVVREDVTGGDGVGAGVEVGGDTDAESVGCPARSPARLIIPAGGLAALALRRSFDTDTKPERP
jgi:hypothetical protein